MARSVPAASDARESEILSQVLREIGSRTDARLWRSNTGVATYGTTKVRYGLPGSADLTGVLHDSKRIEIEVKSATGRQSAQQLAFQAMIERFNGIYILARSAEDALKQLRNKGYCNAP